MIEKTKQKIKKYLNKNIKFKYNGSRNQIEIFEGTIIKCYNNLFLIEGKNFTKTFTYSDVYIGLLEINI